MESPLQPRKVERGAARHDIKKVAEIRTYIGNETCISVEPGGDKQRVDRLAVECDPRSDFHERDRCPVKSAKSR